MMGTTSHHGNKKQQEIRFVTMLFRRTSWTRAISAGRIRARAARDIAEGAVVVPDYAMTRVVHSFRLSCKDTLGY